MKFRLRIFLMCCLFVGSLAFTQQHPVATHRPRSNRTTNAQSLSRFSRSVLNAFQREDMAAFKRVCATEIRLAQYMRVYPQRLSGEQTKELFPPVLLTSEPNEDTHWSATLSQHWNLSRPLTRKEKQTFTRLCHLIQTTLRERPLSVEVQTMHSPIEADTGVWGPMIHGVYASNLDWYLLYTQRGKSWEVKQVIVTAH